MAVFRVGRQTPACPLFSTHILQPLLRRLTVADAMFVTSFYPPAAAQLTVEQHYGWLSAAPADIKQALTSPDAVASFRASIGRLRTMGLVVTAAGPDGSNPVIGVRREVRVTWSDGRSYAAPAHDAAGRYNGIALAVYLDALRAGGVVTAPGIVAVPTPGDGTKPPPLPPAATAALTPENVAIAVAKLRDDVGVALSEGVGPRTRFIGSAGRGALRVAAGTAAGGGGVAAAGGGGGGGGVAGGGGGDAPAAAATTPAGPADPKPTSSAPVPPTTPRPSATSSYYFIDLMAPIGFILPPTTSVSPRPPGPPSPQSTPSTSAHTASDTVALPCTPPPGRLADFPKTSLAWRLYAQDAPTAPRTPSIMKANGLLSHTPTRLWMLHTALVYGAYGRAVSGNIVRSPASVTRSPSDCVVSLIDTLAFTMTDVLRCAVGVIEPPATLRRTLLASLAPRELAAALASGGFSRFAHLVKLLASTTDAVTTLQVEAATGWDALEIVMHGVVEKVGSGGRVTVHTILREDGTMDPGGLAAYWRAQGVEV